jgi:toxin ParE1/3/4
MGVGSQNAFGRIKIRQSKAHSWRGSIPEHIEMLREMTCEFHPEAEKEFLAAINYYEECRIGLGYDFTREVYSAIQSIIEHPKTWPLFDLGIRRRLISRFPYAILYSEEGQTIYILAVMHLRRDPTYWKYRLS